MDTSSSEWGEDKEFTSEKVRDMSLNNYSYILNLGRWSKNNPKDDQILSLVGVEQNLADESKK